MFNDFDTILEDIRAGLKRCAEEKSKKFKPLPDAIQVWLNSKFLSFGRMVAATKRDAKPETVFNANIVTRTYGKIWFGDLNTVTDIKWLQDLANVLSESIYVLREFDARFETEVNPVFENAVLIVEPQEIK